MRHKRDAEIQRPEDYATKIREWKSSLDVFCLQMLKIRTKEHGIQPLDLNNAQKYVLKQMVDSKKLTGRMYFIILKARQLGMSTLLAAFLYHLCRFNEGQNAMLIGGNDEQMKRLLNIVHLFQKRSRVAYRPATNAWNARELHFQELDSHLYIDSSHDANAGRSSTLQGLLATELSIWHDPQTSLGALMQAVPDSGSVFIEFTGKGISHYSYQLWQESKRGENDFVPIFMPWFLDPDYTHRLSPDDEREIRDSLTEEEKYYVEKFKLSMGQISWRRYAIRTKCQNSLDLFRQEYPAEDTEAFVIYGRSIFDKSFLKEQSEHTSEGVRGEIRKDGTFKQTSMGMLSIYRPPEPGQEYFAGWDISMGLDDSDPECGEVVDKSLRQCAEWHGKLDPVKLAEPVIGLGRYYRNATVAIEVNKMGIMTQHEVMKEYPYVYRHHYLNKQANQESNTYGWNTNVSTKPALVAYAIHLASERIPSIRSARLLDEMKTYVQHGECQWAASSGRTDDTVSAWMIACFVAKVMLGGRIETGVGDVAPAYEKAVEKRFKSGGKEIFFPEKEDSQMPITEGGVAPWMSD